MCAAKARLNATGQCTSGCCALAGRLGDLREAGGQRLRLVLTPLGHMTGRLPVGKPDGSTVSAFGSLPVSPDLQTLLIDVKN